MRVLSVLLLTSLLFSLPARAEGKTGLRVWVRGLDDAGVAGVVLALVDETKQPSTAMTNATGVAEVIGLPGTYVRIVGATAPDGSALLMDENDSDGGLRIPLQAGQIQPLALRTVDGMLFVEPVAEPAEPGPAAAQAPVVATRAPDDSPAAAGVSVPTPHEVAAQSGWGWVRTLVLVISGLLALLVVAVQAAHIVRARRRAA